MSIALYPLKFKPQLKEKIWGGNKLLSTLGKKGKGSNYGESWEISDVDGSESIIDNGYLKGKTLSWLLNNYPVEILGEKNYKRFGSRFPLLIKYIDAKTDLSVQLHPNDTLAKKRHDSFGKTEMWYVMQADTGSNLIIGFNDKMNEHEYLQSLENNKLVDILNHVPVSEGATFFIEAGRIHAIGGGVLLAEIQQTSDITYRVYDWDRLDDEGNARDLHLDLAMDAIDFNDDESYKISYEKKLNVSNEMVNCKYFTTNFIKLNGRLSKINTFNSFIIYMCVKGRASIHLNGASTSLGYGETLLMPSAVEKFDLSSDSSELLEIYV